MQAIIHRKRFHSEFILTITALILFCSTSLQAQAYEGHACGAGKPGLKAMFKTGNLNGLILDEGVTGAWNGWSSSLLKNTAKMPARMEDYDVELDGDSDKHAWSCYYSAHSAVDGNQESGWSEGVQGDGIGEILIVPVDTTKGIKIWGGLGKSASLFAKNNRPKKIRVYFLDARKTNVTQSGMIYSDIKIVGSNVQTLKDLNGFQSIGRPKHLVQGKSLLAIEILSVYKGSRWQDTVISEIRN